MLDIQPTDNRDLEKQYMWEGKYPKKLDPTTEPFAEQTTEDKEEILKIA